MNNRSAIEYNTNGLKLLEEKKYGEAIKNFLNALAVKENNFANEPNAYYNLAIAYAFMKEKEQSEHYLTFAKEKNEQYGDKKIVNLLIDILEEKSDDLVMYHDFFYEKALKLKPLNAHTYFELGVYYGRHNNFKESIKNLELAMHDNPQEYDTNMTYKILAAIYRNWAVHLAGTVNFSAIFLNDNGALATMKKSFDYWNKCIKLKPYDPYAYYQIFLNHWTEITCEFYRLAHRTSSRTFNKFDDEGDIEKIYMEAVKYLNLAMEKGKSILQKDYGHMINLFWQEFNNAPSPDVIQSFITLTKNAVSAYSENLDFIIQHGRAYLLLVENLKKNKNVDKKNLNECLTEAHKIFNKAILINETNENFEHKPYYWQGRCYEEEGNDIKAIEFYKKAQDLNPKKKLKELFFYGLLENLSGFPTIKNRNELCQHFIKEKSLTPEKANTLVKRATKIHVLMNKHGATYEQALLYLYVMSNEGHATWLIQGKQKIQTNLMGNVNKEAFFQPNIYVQITADLLGCKFQDAKKIIEIARTRLPRKEKSNGGNAPKKTNYSK